MIKSLFGYSDPEKEERKEPKRGFLDRIKRAVTGEPEAAPVSSQAQTLTEEPDQEPVPPVIPPVVPIEAPVPLPLAPVALPVQDEDEEIEELPRFSLFDRMRQAVTRTRENLSERIDEIVSVGKEIDRDTLDDLEAILLSADLGSETTNEVLERIRVRVARHEVDNANELKRLLKEELLNILNSTTIEAGEPGPGEPEVVLVVGVNGTGKTTTIGKLAAGLKRDGYSVLLCAADTFRAAAIEQLEIWGQRTHTDVIKTKAGGDPSAVLFDGLNAAKARNVDYVIVDTAGRLHTKSNLMQELEKMRRTAQKVVPSAPHETLLVMDATTGQNGLQQARQFTAAAGVTGIVLTKLDGTAKGGVVFAISRELGIPVRYVGVGEKVGDLLPFNAKVFVEGLFN